MTHKIHALEKTNKPKNEHEKKHKGRQYTHANMQFHCILLAFVSFLTCQMMVLWDCRSGLPPLESVNIQRVGNETKKSTILPTGALHCGGLLAGVGVTRPHIICQLHSKRKTTGVDICNGAGSTH